ncbi:MAG: hypothetical protein MPL62_07250 [Alphaproteobacteria bacterium]|nr:hypothetical protein [Alphaproteobacteria bacterium]
MRFALRGLDSGYWIRWILDGRRSWCQLRTEGRAWPGGFIDGARISVILADFWLFLALVGV